MKKTSCLLASCLFASTVLAQGSPDNPVNITTRAELEAITNSTGHYQLANDIDLSGKNWNPLFQDYENGFSGTLLDNGFVLGNLTMVSSSGEDTAFIHHLGSNSRVSLRFKNASVQVAGSHGTTGVALGIAIIVGNNNQVTLRAIHSQVKVTGSDNGRTALCIAEISGNHNRLEWLDSEAVRVITEQGGVGNDASLAVALDTGENTHLTLARLHRVSLVSDNRFIGGAIGRQNPGDSSTVVMQDISGLTVESRCQLIPPMLALVTGFVISDTDNKQSYFTLQRVSGDLRYTGSSTDAIEALVGGLLFARQRVQGTLLGVNTHPGGNALISDQAQNDNCTGAHWDISRNGRTQPGCPGGVGLRSQQPQGWQTLWGLLELAPAEQVPGEATLYPMGDSEQLITRQTYPRYNRTNGYYDENGDFQEDGTGPLILRSLSLTPDGLNLTFGEPVAFNLTGDPGGLWQQNPNQFTLMTLDNQQAQWHTLNLGEQTVSFDNSMDFVGDVLTLDNENLYTWLESENRIRCYQLNEQTFTDYIPAPHFDPSGQFVSAPGPVLIQVLKDDSYNIDISEALTSGNPVNLSYGQEHFRISAAFDTENPHHLLVVLMPAGVHTVNGTEVNIKDPQYPWQPYEAEFDYAEATATLTPTSPTPAPNKNDDHRLAIGMGVGVSIVTMVAVGIGTAIGVRFIYQKKRREGYTRL